jgi:transposase-like protein
MLIIKKPEPKSTAGDWYQENKERLSQKRKKLYAENPEYSQRALEASRRYRRGERTPSMPADAPISISEAADRLGIGTSTLREWRRKEVFKQKLLPEPKYYKGGVWFTEKQIELLRLLQIELLRLLKEFFRKYKMRPSKMTQPILAELRSSIFVCGQ